MEKNASLILGLALLIGLIGSGFLIGKGISQISARDRYVTVRGLSERDVTSDLATWNIRFNATGDDLSSLQKKLEDDQKKVIDFLQAQKITPEEWQIGQLKMVDLLAREYRGNEGNSNRYILESSVTVRSQRIEVLDGASRHVGDMVRSGVSLLNNRGPEFFFTKLNDIKPEMIAESTRAARSAAEQFAKDANANVGSIARASQGLFSIEPRDPAPVDGDYGSSNASIYKKVRIVSTIDYYLD